MEIKRVLSMEIKEVSLNGNKRGFFPWKWISINKMGFFLLK
jgi:hypothetical protein